MRFPNHLRQTKVPESKIESVPIIEKQVVEEESDSNVSLECSDSDDTYDSLQKLFHQKASYDDR